ncbi:MAG: hypothetical protein AAB074_20160 [Planctomycetota bacterium]
MKRLLVPLRQGFRRVVPRRLRRPVLILGWVAHFAILAAAGLVVWARFDSGCDPVAKLPADVEAFVQVRSAAAAAGPLGALSGRNLDALRQSGWFGHFGGAAAGIRGKDLVAVVECPRLAQFGPMESAAKRALGIQETAGGLELAGVPVFLASRGNWLWIATSKSLLADSVACAGRFAVATGTTDLTFKDRGFLARWDGERAAGRLNDIERMAYSRLRGALEPAGEAQGTFDGNALVLKGGARWRLGPRETARRAAASAPAMPSRLASWTIPGLALRHGENFNARAVWDEIVHDPENARFVSAFQREIGDYEKFLGGRKFERDLLPKFGPERLWAVTRIDHAGFGVKPKSPIPAVLFAWEVRGIEAEALKSIDKFLTESELEGRRVDLPMPKGRAAPVLDPFRHDKITFEGREVWRIVFREGVSEFGQEFAPGYAVIDGTLWVSTFWPLLTKITPAAPSNPPGHARGVLEGPLAVALARDLAGEFAEMEATWELLDRVAPASEDDFRGRYGTTEQPTEAYLRIFDDLEKDLKRERPELRGSPFDHELEERLKAWEAGEKRAFSARRAEGLKKGDAFRTEVGQRRATIESRLGLLGGLGRIDWQLQRSLIGNEEIDEWEIRIQPAAR